MQPHRSQARHQDRTGSGPGRGEILAFLSGIVWIGICAALYRWAPETIGPSFALPIALIGIAYLQARQLRRLRAEARGLSEEVSEARKAREEAARNAPLPPPANPGAASEVPLFRSGHRPVVSPPAALAFASRRDHSHRDPAPPTAMVEQDGQGRLPLGTDLETPPSLSRHDMIRALNFPASPEDMDGFRALRRALKQPDLAPLVQAAQDVLTLLSQVGLYMDDLEPDRAKPDLWRRFAEGERGGAVTALAGLRDETALALCMQQMRGDPVFRDAAHHFMRHFDRFLSHHGAALDDAELVALADTRTARAFMLLGRVAGAFD